MPDAPKRPCRGCGRATHGGYCDARRLQGRAKEQRPNFRQRGYDAEWSKLSLAFRQAHPLCADPYNRHPNRLVPSAHTDHIIPHKGDRTLLFDIGNLQALCAACHSSKTAREDGGFGRAPMRS